MSVLYDYRTERGVADVIRFAVTDATGAVVDVTGYAFAYLAKRAYATADAAADVIGAVTVADAAGGVLTITVTPADKAALAAPVVLRHELVATTPAGERLPVFTGRLSIDVGVARGS